MLLHMVVDKVAGMMADMAPALFTHFAGINFPLSLTTSGRGSMEYIEEVQKQLEVVVVVKEEKIKAGRRCSATLKCSAFNPVCR